MQIMDLKPDDENNVRQAANILFEGFKDIWPHICPNLEAALKEVHKSFEFYQKLGFVIVGVIPDANGLGKRDIFMAKRVSE